MTTGLQSGYAFELNDHEADTWLPGDWLLAPDDAWDTVVIDAHPHDAGACDYMGTRTIDGSRCTVWRVQRTTLVSSSIYYAQTAVTAPPPAVKRWTSR